MKKKFKDDPENYREMNKPHDSIESFQSSLDGFYEKVREARKEFGLSDVLIVVKDSAIGKDGEIGGFFHHGQLGNQLNGETMAAYAYGQLQSERENILSRLLQNK
jgi:hypothetical protein